MILYHLDRLKSLKDGQSIELFPLSSLEPDIRSSSFLSQFSNGVSSHALTYLTNKCKTLLSLSLPSMTPGKMVDYIAVPSLMINKYFSDAQMSEVTLELVRRSCFPNLPSRFTSLFAVDSVDEFDKWQELTHENGINQNYPIFSLEVSDSTPKFDSNWLKGGLNLGFDSSIGKYYLGYMPTANYDFAFNYWSGIPSDLPRWEYLIELPISKVKLQSKKA